MELTIPNILTIFRLITVPILGLCFIFDWHAAAMILFMAAGGTDLIDGYIARRLNQFSKFGAILDPIADKLLMAVTFIGLAAIDAIGWWFVTIMLVKDLFIVAGILYFMRQKMHFEYRPIYWSKITTLCLLLIASFSLIDLTFPGAALWHFELGDFVYGGLYITALLMIITFLEYLRVGLEIIAQKQSENV